MKPRCYICDAEIEIDIDEYIEKINEEFLCDECSDIVYINCMYILLTKN